MFLHAAQISSFHQACGALAFAYEALAFAFRSLIFCRPDASDPLTDKDPLLDEAVYRPLVKPYYDPAVYIYYRNASLP